VRRLFAASALALVTACAVPSAVPVQSAPPLLQSEPRVIESFDDAGAWEAVPASGVQMQLANDSGQSGRALRVDFDFRGGGGWAALRREVDLKLPENYELSFWIKGAAPRNTLEFKLIDASGENVWWVNRPEFEYQGDWRRITFRKRHVSFAWGPARGGDIRDVAAIEFAITAGTGGRGTVWFDDFTVRELEPVRPYDLTPVVVAASEAQSSLMDRDSTTIWRSDDNARQYVTIDFLRNREFGGLRIDWERPGRAVDYDVQVSNDGTTWQTIRQVRSGGRPRDYLALPETEARWLRLDLQRAELDAFAIRDIEVLPLEWGASANRLFESLAKDAPRGFYPLYFDSVQSYWTLVGIPNDEREALIDAQGMLEVDRRAFSIEPFLFNDGKLITWADMRNTPSLARGDLPIPSVRRESGSLALTVTAWADGEPGAALLWSRYRVQNHGTTTASTKLYLAVRPFQVNPTWQFLNNPGGASTVSSIVFRDGRVTVDSTRTVVAVTRPDGFGAAAFDQGDITQWLARGELPSRTSVKDPIGHVSAALAYELTIPAGGSTDVIIAAPFYAASPIPAVAVDAQTASRIGNERLDAATTDWANRLDRFSLELPGEAARIARSIHSNLAYILINQDGPSIQPGSRSYERSWIRDGSLTSSALLKLGHAEEVKRFIEWYAPHQYADGKVPCCVDHRGADPVPENDSHGQLIYLIAEYYRHTGDRALVERMWPHVERAVLYMDSLRLSRRTGDWLTRDNGAFKGLLPESISHEGYSEKPMHSYWDQFFALKGFKDAVFLAETLGKEQRARFAGIRDEYQTDLIASLEQAMRNHNIDYLPGAAELGDFDATSTTVGITPAGATAILPQKALLQTFERYWEETAARRSGRKVWDAYTPYELRTVGTFVRLGQRERAHTLLDWFFTHQRPAEWNHWAEVVFPDPATPRFIGDMPHTWVGSDFIRSALDMFAYEREHDDALVIGAGVLPEWMAGEGVRLRGLSTHYGKLGYTMQQRADSVVIEFAGELRTPAGGVVIHSPLEQAPKRVTVDGRNTTVTGTTIELPRIPRRVVLHY